MRQWMRAFGVITLLTAAGANGQDRATSPASPIPSASSLVTLPATVPGTGEHALDKTDLDAWLDGYFPGALRTAAIPARS